MFVRCLSRREDTVWRVIHEERRRRKTTLTTGRPNVRSPVPRHWAPGLCQGGSPAHAALIAEVTGLMRRLDTGSDTMPVRTDPVGMPSGDAFPASGPPVGSGADLDRTCREWRLSETVCASTKMR